MKIKKNNNNFKIYYLLPNYSVGNITLHRSFYSIVEAIIFVKDLQNMTIKKMNEKISLECEISKENLKLEWYKGNKKLRRDEKYDIVNKGKVHQLVIDDINDKDVGTYKAVYKTIETSAKLDLAGKIQFL